jgi:hypothetical protein
VAGKLGKLTFEHTFCPVCAKRDAYDRILAKADEEWNERHPDADPKAPRPSDGRSTRLRPLTDAEAELIEERRRRG